MAKGVVIVIGHGPSAEGKGRGSEIDKHTVVRMDNCDWQNKEDYGSRWDYGLICPPTMKIYNPFPSQGWWMYDPNDSDDETVFFIGGKSVTKLFYQPWLARARSMGAQPDPGHKLKLTRGCVAICATIEMIQPTDILLIGFDMIKVGETVAAHHAKSYRGPADTFKPAGCPREGAHDFSVERHLILSMTNERNINLKWVN